MEKDESLEDILGVGGMWEMDMTGWVAKRQAVVGDGYGKASGRCEAASELGVVGLVISGE